MPSLISRCPDLRTLEASNRCLATVTRNPQIPVASHLLPNSSPRSLLRECQPCPCDKSRVFQCDCNARLSTTLSLRLCLWCSSYESFCVPFLDQSHTGRWRHRNIQLHTPVVRHGHHSIRRRGPASVAIAGCQSNVRPGLMGISKSDGVPSYYRIGLHHHECHHFPSSFQSLIRALDRATVLGILITFGVRSLQSHRCSPSSANHAYADTGLLSSCVPTLCKIQTGPQAWIR